MNPAHLIPLEGKATEHSPSIKTEAALTTVNGRTMEKQGSLPQQDNQKPEASQPGEDLPEHHVSMSFPQRLMEILDDESNADSIAWLPHGKGFIIYKKKKFADEILGRYFKKAKFTSFTRKLNRWGFSRVSRGQESGAYYQKFFQRGNARLCTQMTCQGNNNQAPQDLPPAMMGGLRLDPIELSQLLKLQQMQIQQLQQKQHLFNSMLTAATPQMQMAPPMMSALAPQAFLGKAMMPSAMAPNNALTANARLLGMPPATNTVVIQGAEGATDGSPSAGVKRASAA